MKPLEVTPNVEEMARAVYRAVMLGDWDSRAHVFAVTPADADHLPDTVAGVAVVARYDVGNNQCFLMRRVDLEVEE